MKISSFIILTLIPVVLMEKATEEKSEDSDRIKRSGFSLLGGAIQNLQKSAFGASASLSQGSAGGVAHLSSSSSSSGHSSHGYDTNSYGGHDDFDHHDNHDSKGFDGWSLKKSILNTLLQAVKAIAGGVTTLQGQLIKGSGYVVEQKGKLIQSGGDQVTNIGKNIIHNSHLVKPETSHGHGHSSLGHSLGSSFGGLTKTISSLSAGSSGSLSSVSGASSSSSSSHGHGHDTSYPSHGGEYAAIDGHGIEYTNSFDNYDTKPVVHESYGPPKTTISHIEQPHAIYGTPEYNDDTYKFAETQVTDLHADMLSEILKNIPHKPMKSVTSTGHSFNQIPIPSDSPLPPPPFKPLKTFPVYSPPSPSFESPNLYSSDFDSNSVNTDPKAYDAYHSMTMKHSKPQAVVSTSLPGPISLNLLADKDFEIQKSVQYEFHT